MLADLRSIIALAGRARIAGFAVLATIAAASEGLGLVLIVPLIAALDPRGTVELGLPAWPLAPLLGVFVLLVAVRALADVMRGLAAFGLQVRVVDGLRDRATKALLGAEWRALSVMRQSANRALLVTSVDRVGEAVGHLAALARTIVAMLALLVAALALSPAFAFASLALGLAALVVLGGVRRHARRLGEAMSARYDDIHLRLEETLSSLRLVKSFGREEREGDHIADGFRQLRGAERHYLRNSATARALLQIAAALLIALAVWLAVERWNVGPAYLLAFAALAVRGVPLVEALQESWQGWHHTAPALAEAEALIALTLAAAEPPPVTVQPMLGSIALSQARVTHAAGRTALEDVSFAIPRGQVVAVVGPSGAGKSTVADLLGGLISPDSGEVLLDGKQLEGGLRQGWRTRVAYVQQDAVLFTGSIRDNLLWAKDEASEAELIRVLEQAAAQFVLALPRGLDEQLGEGGRNLSGGERQRIALARALLRDPDLLILDEATSAVDPASEAMIAQAVVALAGDRTILVIGHRGALVDAASLRFHLRDGRLQQG